MSNQIIIDVDDGIIEIGGEGYPVDTSTLEGKDVAVVVYDGNDYWYEAKPFNGREKDATIKAMADYIYDAGMEQYDAENSELTAQQKLKEERKQMAVSAFQAKAALMQYGYYDQIVEYMNTNADAVTKLAWDSAQEFRRTSPTVNAISTLLNMSDTEVDDLFRLADTIEA